jgi:hypothetical protein
MRRYRLRLGLELHPYRDRPDAEAAALAQLEMLTRELARDLRAPGVCGGLPNRKALRFAYEVSAGILLISTASIQRSGPQDVRCIWVRPLFPSERFSQSGFIHG